VDTHIRRQDVCRRPTGFVSEGRPQLVRNVDEDGAALSHQRERRIHGSQPAHRRLARVADAGSAGSGGLRAPTIPIADLPPAQTLGQVPVVDLQGVTSKAIAGSSGIGVQYLYNKNGLNLNAYGLISIRDAGIDFFLHIKNATIQDCGVRMKGAVGLKLHLNSSSTQEFKVNFHKKLTLPVDLTIPLGAAGVPLEMTFNEAFSVDTGFSAITPSAAGSTPAIGSGHGG
jgi:hypothetical protein